MLGLTAHYADMWNTTDPDPEVMAESLAKLHAACCAVGRDPATLAVTARLTVAYPGIGTPPAWIKPDLPGSAEAIAAALHQYEALGVSQLMFDGGPSNLTTLARLAEAVNLYRGSTNRAECGEQAELATVED